MSKRYLGGFITVSYNPLLVPNAPTIGTATGGNAQASVTFTAPTNVGGSAITGYIATARNSSSGALFTATGTASPIVITGLPNENTYTLTVAAINSFGTGPVSAASNSVSLEVPSNIVFITEVTSISAGGWTGGVLREFTFTNTTAYRYWRFIFGSITNSGGYRSLVEWQIKVAGTTQSLNGKTMGNLGAAFTIGGLTNLQNNDLAGSDIAATLDPGAYDVYVDLGSAQVVNGYMLAPQDNNPPIFNTPGSFKVYASTSLSGIQQTV